MTRRHCVPSPIDSDSEEDLMDVDDGDHDDDDSDGTASDSSEETDLTDPADYGEDGKNDARDLAGLLVSDEHLSEYYMNMMTDSDRSLLQYNKYTPNSQKLLDHIK
ncbi:hypothetical protein BDFG_07648 [Blastomyces dermatitidis ATCC 26199]|nr:hypothetical protein BDFG_07648 [Blastomyces dermatitidis ATCC 26199]